MDEGLEQEDQVGKMKDRGCEGENIGDTDKIKGHLRDSMET